MEETWEKWRRGCAKWRHIYYEVREGDYEWLWRCPGSSRSSFLFRWVAGETWIIFNFPVRTAQQTLVSVIKTRYLKIPFLPTSKHICLLYKKTNVLRSSPYRAVNTASVIKTSHIDVQGSNRCLFWDSYKTQKESGIFLLLQLAVRKVRGGVRK
jgi:hypothetical protein